MSKFLKSFLLSSLLLGLVSPVFSAGEVGTVDNARVLEEYSGSKEAQRKVLESREKLQKTFADLNSNLEKTLQDKKLSEAQKLQKRKEAQETLELEKKKLDQMVDSMRASIESKIEGAIQEEAKAQGLSMVVAKNVTFFGGKDITDAVLNRLKK